MPVIEDQYKRVVSPRCCLHHEIWSGPSNNSWEKRIISCFEHALPLLRVMQPRVELTVIYWSPIDTFVLGNICIGNYCL